MTKFEENGVRKQNEAYKLSFAEKQFAFSCDQCCMKGLRRGPCESCPISIAHDRAVQEIVCGERSKPSYHKSTDKKGHVTLTLIINQNSNANVKVIIK